MKTGNLKIGRLTTREQAEELEKALSAQRGVRSASVQPGDPAGAEVEYEEDHLSLEQVVAKLRDEGYDARIGGHSAGGAA